MKITVARITNYKRIRDVTITPDADSHLILLGGSNAAGKTSVLDALDAAIGGKARVAGDPVHHGMARAAITIEYDGGALVVERIIEPNGETTLKVSVKDGSVRSPQALLDRLLGQRMIDPLAFLRLDPKDQRAALLKLIDAKGELSDLEARRERIFEKRTEIGRDLKKAEGELARLPPAPETAGVAVDVASLSAERARFAERQHENAKLSATYDAAARDAKTARTVVVDMQTEIEQLEKRLVDVRRMLITAAEGATAKEAAADQHAVAVATAAEEWKNSLGRRDEIDAQLGHADAHNRAVFAMESAAKRRAEAQDAIDKLAATRTKQTEMLDKIEAQKVAFLAAAKLPIDGLGVEVAGRNCYAERVAARFSDPGMPYEGLAKRIAREVRQFKVVGGEPTGEFRTATKYEPRWTGDVRMVPEHLADPLRWKKPLRIFVNSMSDLFHEALTNEQIAAAFGVMAAAPRHTFQVLTKRPKRMREWFAWVAEYGLSVLALEASLHLGEDRDYIGSEQPSWPLPNVWLGVSVEDQEAATTRIPELLGTPAAVRFLSMEPLLGAIDLAAASPNSRSFAEDLDWVIAGCESGPGARRCKVEWLRSIRDQCAAAHVPFFLKQAQHIDGAYTITDIRPIPRVLGRQGELIPVIGVGDGSREKARGVIELPYLDGVQHAAFPTDVAMVVNAQVGR